MIETAVYQLLTSAYGNDNDTAYDLAAIVAGRVYPNEAKQLASRPFIVYQRVSASRVTSMDGSSGLTSVRFQVTCTADRYYDAKSLADAVRANLHGYSGTIDGTRIQSCFEIDDGDMPYFSPGNEGLRLKAVRTDYQLWHDE